MTIFAKVTAVAALVAATIASVPARAQPTSVQERRGEELVSRDCAMCHAVGRSGGSVQSKAPAFHSIARSMPIDELKSALQRGVLSGHPEMPHIRYDTTDVEAIVAYMRSLQEP